MSKKKDNTTRNVVLCVIALVLIVGLCICLKTDLFKTNEKVNKDEARPVFNEKNAKKVDFDYYLGDFIYEIVNDKITETYKIKFNKSETDSAYIMDADYIKVDTSNERKPKVETLTGTVFDIKIDDKGELEYNELENTVKVIAVEDDSIQLSAVVTTNEDVMAKFNDLVLTKVYSEEIENLDEGIEE